jgi:hypothetical protein
VVLEKRKRLYCDQCFPEQRKQMIGTRAEAGLRTLE